jgi:hypothetical protein
MLKNSIEKYNNNKRLKETYKARSAEGNTEGNNEGNTEGNTEVGSGSNKEVNIVYTPESDLYLVLMLAVSFIFFVFEFLLLVIAIMIAIKTTSEGKERFVHLVLAIFYTMPYLLLMAVFNEDAKKYLKLSGKESSYSAQASCGF